MEARLGISRRVQLSHLLRAQVNIEAFQVFIELFDGAGGDQRNRDRIRGKHPGKNNLNRRRAGFTRHFLQRLKPVKEVGTLVDVTNFSVLPLVRAAESESRCCPAVGAFAHLEQRLHARFAR